MAAEERAHKIVERLVLEDKVTRDFLVNSVSLIVFQGNVARFEGRGVHLKYLKRRDGIYFCPVLCSNCALVYGFPQGASGIPTGFDIKLPPLG